MARTARRATPAFGLEVLEARALLSSDLLTGTGPWLPQTPLTPSTTVLIKFTSSASASQVRDDLAAVGGKVVNTYPNGPSVVALPPWAAAKADLAFLSSQPGISYADADAAIHSLGAVIPNDPGYNQQYGLSAIDAPDAWGVTTGTSSTIVAVLDTGVDLNSPDLDPHLWTSPSNPKVHGWNFINNNSSIQDGNGHGTNVTGILAAIGDNNLGVAGVDWNATIMPLKVLDSQGNGSTDAAVSAIYYAVQHGARVLNASWGGGEYSHAMIDAINYAGTQGAVFITAAGNDTSNNDTTPTYPASYRLANELVVAATDQNGDLADFSNYGATTVDLAAPGVNILSTVPGGYAADTGTSMSTPFVSGAAALLVGLYPGLTATQVVSRIKATVKPDPALTGLVATGGELDAYYALVNYVSPSGGNSASGGAAGPVSLQSLEQSILSTDDVYKGYGGSDAWYVTGLYQAMLGRTPDAPGLAYHVAELQSGESRVALISEFQNSAEAEITRVSRWYIDELGASQTLDQLKASPYLAGWPAVFAAGQTYAAAQDALIGSDSYYQGLGGTPAAYVTALYKGLLGRAPDADGLSYYVGMLNSGTSRADLAEKFLSSTEGHLTTVARLYLEEMGSTSSLPALKTNPGVAYWASQLGDD